MKTGVGMTTAGFAWLYPLRFAGDGGNHRGIAPTRGCRDDSLPRVLGVSPNLLTTPKNGGSRGLKASLGELDSRFPASARTGPVSTRTSSAGMIRLRRTEGLGVSPNFLTTPMNGGTRGLKETITDSLSESTYDGFHVKKRYDMLYSYYDDIG